MKFMIVMLLLAICLTSPANNTDSHELNSNNEVKAEISDINSLNDQLNRLNDCLKDLDRHI